MSNKDFEFYVGNIEDGILAALEAQLRPIGVKTFITYSGELDTETLKKAISSLTPKFPLVMVSYTDGDDVQDPKTAPILNKPMHFRHDCSFAVICASADARGENARRRGKETLGRKIGVYTMLSKVREVLSGLRLSLIDDDEKVTLTHSPFKPSGVQYIARIPSITAYASVFDTNFRYSTIDRQEAGINVSELVLGVESRNAPNNTTPTNPGVIFN